MKPIFDVRGNLSPSGKSEFDFDEFKSVFVDSFDSEKRLEIFENYNQYLLDFNEEITPNFVQWIDGSFVSNKMNPADIDFVTLIDFDIYEKNEELIESKFGKYGVRNHYEYVDAYLVKFYPEDHERRKITDFDLVYWLTWFSETKKNRAKKKFPKGFVEIKFGDKKSIQ